MRIVMLRSNPVSPDPRVEKEADSLLKFGHSIRILAWDRFNNGNKSVDELCLESGCAGITRFKIKAGFGSGLKNLVPLIRFQLQLVKWLIINHKNYDCIHACDFDTVLPAWLSKILFNKKLVYDIFDYYVDAFRVPKVLKSVIEYIDTRIMNSAETVIITNESRLSQISKSSPSRIAIIHNSPKLPVHFNHEENVSSKSKIKIAYIGVLDEGRLLAEIVKVVARHPDWELHIGGFGFLQDTVRQYSENFSNINFYGCIPYDQALKIESACDLLFAVYNPEIPNNRYSSPNKLYEAMLLGKPIIVAKGTGIDNIVNENGIGKVIGYSEQEFEEAVEKLISEKDNFTKIKFKCIKLYNEKYSWDIMEQRLINMYFALESKHA